MAGFQMILQRAVARHGDSGHHAVGADCNDAVDGVGCDAV